MKNTIFIILIFTPAILLADIIVLKNGKTLSGKIVGQIRSSIRIKTKAGRNTIAKKTIRSVKFGVTRDEKAIQAKRRQEMARRKALLERARKQKQAARIAAEEKRLADLKKQEDQEVAALKKREKTVLSAEEEMAKLNNEKADLEKKLEAIRRRQAALEGNSERAHSFDYLWRSAVLPGWGQLHAGEDLKGYGLMAGTLATGVYALLRYNDSLALTQDYEASKNLWNGFMVGTGTQTGLAARLLIPQSDLDALNSARSDYANFGLVAGLLYTYNLIDAFFFTGGSATSMNAQQRAGDYSFFATTKHDQMQAGFVLRF